MKTTGKAILTAETEVNAPIGKVWELWTDPKHIVQWNIPSDDWHTFEAVNDVRAGGQFLFAMGLKDDSDKFDFTGMYDEVKINELISYTLTDGRKTTVTFTNHNTVKIIESFEAVENLSADMQKSFCQAVLDRFKKYAEA